MLHRLRAVLPLALTGALAGALPACARLQGLIGFGQGGSAQAANTAATIAESKPARLDGELTGALEYTAHGRLPADAVLVVRLEDTTVKDEPARLLVEHQLTVGGREPGPIPFTLNYEPKLIDARHQYALSASINAGETLLYASDKPLPVITGNSSPQVKLTLQAMPTPD